MSKISSFRSIQNKHNVYRGKDCMKKFNEFLRKHAMKIINFKKKKKIINKRAAKTIWKCIMHEIKRRYLKVRNIVKFIDIIQENMCCA